MEREKNPFPSDLVALSFQPELNGIVEEELPFPSDSAAPISSGLWYCCATSKDVCFDVCAALALFWSPLRVIKKCNPAPRTRAPTPAPISIPAFVPELRAGDLSCVGGELFTVVVEVSVPGVETMIYIGRVSVAETI